MIGDTRTLACSSLLPVGPYTLIGLLGLSYLYRFVLQSESIQRRDGFTSVLRRLVVDKTVSETLS